MFRQKMPKKKKKIQAINMAKKKNHASDRICTSTWYSDEKENVNR